MEKEKSLGFGFPVQKTLKGAYDISWSNEAVVITHYQEEGEYWLHDWQMYRL